MTINNIILNPLLFSLQPDYHLIGRSDFDFTDFLDEATASQSLCKSQEFLELEATLTMTKAVQIQPNGSVLHQTMPEGPIQSFVIQPANPKTGCYSS